MNWGKIIALGVIAGGLVGCGKQAEAPAKSADSKSSQSVKQPVKQQVIWSATKSERLAAFMDEFAESRNQSYAEVTADSDTTWQGLDLSGYIKDKRQVTFDDKTKSVNWLSKKAAASKAKANVVAVYADDTDGIVYLFEVTPAKQTQVWVSQTAPEDGELTVAKTQAAALTNGFKQIVAGKRARLQSADNQQASAVQSSQASSSSSSASSQAKPTASAHEPVFDANYAQTWYTRRDEGSDLQTMQITANGIASPGSTGGPIYLAKERSKADEQIALSPTSGQPDPAKMNWGVAALTADGGVNVRGWYQTNGSGNIYKVVTQTIDGQPQQVMEVYDGYNPEMALYYLTPELANSNPGIHDRGQD